MRIGMAGLALLLAAAPASAKELKPKFGKIDGVYYSDVSGNREACRPPRPRPDWRPSGGIHRVTMA